MPSVRLALLLVALLPIATVGLFGETAEQSLKFEAALVKPTSGDLPEGRVVMGILPLSAAPVQTTQVSFATPQSA
jgi:hypothetical protein